MDGTPDGIFLGVARMGKHEQQGRRDNYAAASNECRGMSAVDTAAQFQTKTHKKKKKNLEKRKLNAAICNIEH